MAFHSLKIPLMMCWHTHSSLKSALSSLRTVVTLKAFEPAPTARNDSSAAAAQPVAGGIESYGVKVDGQVYDVEVGPQGELTSVSPSAEPAQAAQSGSKQHLLRLLMRSRSSSVSGQHFQSYRSAGCWSGWKDRAAILGSDEDGNRSSCCSRWYRSGVEC